MNFIKSFHKAIWCVLCNAGKLLLARGWSVARVVGPNFLLLRKILVFPLWLFACFQSFAAADRPNVVIILADDLAWADVGCYGAKFHETPSLDRFASEGMRFTNGYAAHPSCSPSRAALLTGRYPARLKITEFIPGSGRNGKYLSGEIRKQLPFYDVHTPIQAKDPLIAKYKEKAKRMGLLEAAKSVFKKDGTEARGTKPGLSQNRARQGQNHPAYAAMVETMDTNVGRVLDKLKSLDLDKNTIVIFTSDNGGYPPISSNLPFRGGKGWGYEGGIREPWLVKWPGMTQAGSVCDVPVIFTDIFPTVLDMVGLPLQPELHLDGTSITPLLKGGNESLHDELFWHFPHYGSYGCGPFSSIRQGDWKLIEWLEDESVDLFDLKEDRGEQNNLAETHPEKVNELRKKLHQWRKDVDANMPRPRLAKVKK